MTDQDKHIEKLKKLLALAASGNPHEAALALRRARKLMDVHGITHSDIAMSDIDETISHYWPTGSLRPPRYMLGLMNIIREAFGVNSIIHPGTYPGVGFYGNRERAALAAYTWEVLARQLKKARQQYISAQNKRIKTPTRTSRGDQFAGGWVLAVINEIQSFALTDDERELMQQWLEHKYPQTQTTRARKPGRSRNGDASRYAGFREGQNVRLHRPVSGREQQKLEAR